MTRPITNAPRSVAFRQQREAEWEELEGLVDRVLSRGLSRLNADELHRLPLLYRSALSSLSVARRTAMDRPLLEYLESLAERAYLAVYGSRHPTKGAVVRALFETFPQRVRSFGVELAISTGVLTLGVVVAMALVASDASWYDAFVSPALAGNRNPNADTETLREALYGDNEMLSFFASFLFTNNARIGMLAFALGFAAGVPTAFLLFQNGLMLGAFLQLYAERGLLLPLVGWLLPHGIPEIGAVILCGAAGMHLGRGLLLPGRLTVRASVARAGRRASIVVMGSVVLFAIAGVIEGVFRQVIHDDLARFIFAGFNALWFFAWLFVAGRGKRDAVE